MFEITEEEFVHCLGLVVLTRYAICKLEQDGIGWVGKVGVGKVGKKSGRGTWVPTPPMMH